MQAVNARKPIFILLILITLLLTGCEQEPQDQTKSLSPTLSRAETYVKQGQYKAAIIETKNALRIAPKSIEAISLASRINIDLGQSNSAFLLLEPLKETQNPAIRLLLAEAYLSRGKFRSALNYVNEPYTPSPPLTTQQQLTRHSISFKSNISLGNYSDSANELKHIEALADTNQEKADFHYLAATLFFKQNYFPKVTDAIDKALALDNNHIDALLMKSAIAYKKNELEQSEDTLTTALLALGDTDILLPRKVKVLNALIDVLSSQGRSSEAFIYTKLLSQHNPKATELKSKLKEAIDLYTAGNYDDAEAMLMDINKNTPNAKSRQLLGLLNIKKGNMADAEDYLSQGFDPEIADTKSISLLARTQLQLKQPEKVVAMLKEEVKARNNDPEILALYGLASLASGNEDEGISSLKQAIQIAPNKHRLRIALADYYESNNQSSLALEHLEKAYTAYPDSVDIQQRLLKQYLSIEKPANQTLFYSALKKQTNDSRLNFLVGALQLKNGNKEQATDKLEKAVRADKTNVDALYALALTKLADEKSKSAEQLFLRIIELSPENPQGYKGLTQSMHLNGNGDSIESTMQKLAKQFPSSSGPEEVLSELYLKQKDMDRALIAAKSAYKKNPTLQSSRNQILKTYSIKAQQLMTNKKLSEARGQIIEALKISPNSLIFLSELVRLEIQASRIQEAKKLSEQVEVLAPGSSLSLTLNSDVAYAEGMPDVAMKFISQAWATTKTDTIARKQFNILVQSDKNKAQAFLEEWANAIPKSAEPLRKQGTLALTNKEYPKAISLFEAATQRNANDVVSLNNLAWLYQKQNDPRATAVAKSAHELMPNSAAIKDTYGWILAQQGSKTEAVRLLEDALILDPSNNEIQKHLDEAKKL